MQCLRFVIGLGSSTWKTKPYRCHRLKKKQNCLLYCPARSAKNSLKLHAPSGHSYLLAFAYASGLRMNELRLIKIRDVDVQRMQVHIRNGKGRKQRYVGLSVFLAKRLPVYLDEVKPSVYLFEGL